MPTLPHIKVYVSDSERERIRTIAAERRQSISEFAKAATMNEVQRMESNTDPTLDQLRAQGAAPQAIYQALLKVHNGDTKAAARALALHIQAEQQALVMLLTNGGQPA